MASMRSNAWWPICRARPAARSCRAAKFVKGAKSRGLRIPEEVFTLTITGRYVWETAATDDSSIDVYMKPDPDTVRLVPWYTEPTAQVICDAFSSQ